MKRTAVIRTARSGQTLVEYGLLLMVISIIAVAFLIPFKNTVTTLLTNSLKGINQFSNLTTTQLQTGINNNGLSGQYALTAYPLNNNTGNVR